MFQSKSNFMIFRVIIILFLFSTHTSYAKKKDVIVIHNPEISPREKEAIIILPGLGDSKDGRKNQLAFFGDLEYDLFIPNFLDKESVDASLTKFTTFFNDKELGEYKKIHVFSYILGSWVMNKFILKNGPMNIASIVYDRSPIQERAPIVLVENIPLIARMMKGKIVRDISTIPYPTITQGDIKIGILVESTATKLMRHFEKEAKEKGPIEWTNLDFKQSSDDIIFTPLNHDDMYLHFEVVGNDIISFFKDGAFTKTAQRSWFNWNPFDKTARF